MMINIIDGWVSGQQARRPEVLLRGVGTLRYFFPPSASVQYQPDGLTIHTKKGLLGAGFLGAPPISLTLPGRRGRTRIRTGLRNHLS